MCYMFVRGTIHKTDVVILSRDMVCMRIEKCNSISYEIIPLDLHYVKGLLHEHNFKAKYNSCFLSYHGCANFTLHIGKHF